VIANLVVGTLMVCATVLMHFWGLLGLTRIMSHGSARLKPSTSTRRQALIILMVVLGVFAVHTSEIWLYASLYDALHETANFEDALYVSTISFVCLGNGDVVLGPAWRLVGAIEGANGAILLGWSTAFLLSVTARLKLLEHDWLEGPT
jgi:hypothetical protein